LTARLLTLAEVADELGCSVPTVKRRVRAGALPIFRDGRLVRVREADLRRYVIERVDRRERRPVSVAAAGRAVPEGSRLWD
jgi:excisionase family DNA binding protein